MKRAVHTIDAAGRSLGRVATEAALHLMGKHRPTYRPNADEGDAVKVLNASKIKWTGKKLEQKEYKWSTMYLGGLKTKRVSEVFARDPGEVVRRAVSNMLPKNTFRTARLNRLSVEK